MLLLFFILAVFGALSIALFHSDMGHLGYIHLHLQKESCRFKGAITKM